MQFDSFNYMTKFVFICVLDSLIKYMHFFGLYNYGVDFNIEAI